MSWPFRQVARRRRPAPTYSLATDGQKIIDTGMLWRIFFHFYVIDYCNRQGWESAFISSGSGFRIRIHWPDKHWKSVKVFEEEKNICWKICYGVGDLNRLQLTNNITNKNLSSGCQIPEVMWCCPQWCGHYSRRFDTSWVEEEKLCQNILHW